MNFGKEKEFASHMYNDVIQTPLKILDYPRLTVKTAW
jgi:hypothetical protein